MTKEMKPMEDSKKVKNIFMFGSKNNYLKKAPTKAYNSTNVSANKRVRGRTKR